jgi:hypothetical protein
MNLDSDETEKPDESPKFSVGDLLLFNEISDLDDRDADLDDAPEEPADAPEEPREHDPWDDWEATYDPIDPIADAYRRWEEEEEARRGEGGARGASAFGAFKPSQGEVQIFGRDTLRIGMTCDVECGVRRQTVEVEIVDIHATNKRLVIVERTDGKLWDHEKAHTRIVKP